MHIFTKDAITSDIVPFAKPRIRVHNVWALLNIPVFSDFALFHCSGSTPAWNRFVIVDARIE